MAPLQLSARAFLRILKLARIIADLAGSEAAAAGGEVVGEDEAEPGGAAGGGAAESQDEHLEGTTDNAAWGEALLADEVNQIELNFPSEDGDASGFMYKVLKLDLRLWIGDIVSLCTKKVTIEGNLTGTYDADTGRLAGDFGGNWTAVVVSDCEDDEPAVSGAWAGPWEGQFDPSTGLATGSITVSDAGGTAVVTFEARRAP